MAEKDIIEKALEAHNDVFSDIVNGLFFKGEKVLQEQDLIDEQPFSMYKAGGKLHEQERDISKYWVEQKEEKINIRIAFLGIENQSVYDKDMPLRVIGYDGAAYRSEIIYKERYPVITLVLYFGDKPWGKNRSIYDVVTVPERFKPYVNNYRINLFEIAFLPEKAVEYFQSDFKAIVDYFVLVRKDPGYRPKNPQKFKYIDELMKLFSALTQDDRFTDLLMDEGGKPEDMCEVLDRVEEKGRRAGEDQARLEAIKSIMESFNVTARQAMQALKIPEKDWQKYENKL